MRTGIASAGPAGLLFVYLAKRSQPNAEVRVVEQNARDATFGFGVVFSHGALEFLSRDVPAMQDRSAGVEAPAVIAIAPFLLLFTVEVRRHRSEANSV